MISAYGIIEVMSDTIRCPKCGKEMVLRTRRADGHEFYGCKGFPDCRFTLDLEDVENGKIKDPNLRAETEIKRNGGYVKFKTFKEMGGGDNRPHVDFEKVNFPICLKARARADGFSTVFMDTMAIPAETFKLFNDDASLRQGLMNFAKWRLDFVATAENKLTDKQTAILSVIEKIVNRGRLTRLSKELERKLMENEPVSAETMKWIYDDYMVPNVPNEWHDGTKLAELGNMTPEEYFYKKVFLEEVGERHARDIMPQVALGSMIFREEEIAQSLWDQRVDFVICHGIEMIVVEIDDPTHFGHEQKDAWRDAKLLENGVKTYRVNVQELKNGGPSLENIKEKLKEMYAGELEESEKDRMFCVGPLLVKLAHQLQMILIELMKAGKIGYGCKCRVMFDAKNTPMIISGEQKRTIDAAMEDLIELSRNITKLYGDEEGIFDGVELVEEKPDILVTVNDNYEFDQSKIVYLEEISYPVAIQQNEWPRLKMQKMKVDAKALRYVLKYIFRFDDFRPNQIDGVLKSLAGEDSIILLPTGSGKSVVYQLLSFILPGMVMILDPIVSLINDQVDNLRRIGVDRVIGLSKETNNKPMCQKAMQMGQYIMVFMSPERMQIKGFRNDLRGYCAKYCVPVCAIDEAHCVSEWGHDFRPAYLKLARALRRIAKVEGMSPVILALTGTASDVVLNDMERDLGIDDKNVVRPESFDRKEIEFVVRKATSNGKMNVLQDIIYNEIPSRYGESFDRFYDLKGDETMSGIIFALHVTSDWGVKTIRDKLATYGMNVGMFAGEYKSKIGMTEAEWEQCKAESAEGFKDNTVPVLVATKSYGMGIDKPNIRYTIHYGLPQSIEEYYQEAGRAGRDRKQAYSYIIVSNDYPDRNQRLLDLTTPVEKIRGELKSFFNQDDIDRVLSFHSGEYGTFKGVEKDLDDVKKVLDRIGELGEARQVTMPYYLLPNKGIEMVLYRLMVLGVVDDYTVDYLANEVEVKLMEFNEEDLARNYGEYVRKYRNDDDFVRMAEEQVRDVREVDLKESVVAAVEVMLRDFVYKTIENSRRRALANLLETMEMALRENDDAKRSKIVRECILKYLGNTHVDTLKAIIARADDLIEVSRIMKEMPKSKQDEMYAEAGRALESYPEHPGLILARLYARVNVGEMEAGTLSDMAEAVIKFATEMYGVDRDEAFTVVMDALAGLIKRSEKVYLDVIYRMLGRRRGEDFVELAERVPVRYKGVVQLVGLSRAVKPLKLVGEKKINILWNNK